MSVAALNSSCHSKQPQPQQQQQQHSGSGAGLSLALAFNEMDEQQQQQFSYVVNNNSINNNNLAASSSSPTSPSGVASSAGPQLDLTATRVALAPTTTKFTDAGSSGSSLNGSDTKRYKLSFQQQQQQVEKPHHGPAAMNSFTMNGVGSGAVNAQRIITTDKDNYMLKATSSAATTPAAAASTATAGAATDSSVQVSPHTNGRPRSASLSFVSSSASASSSSSSRLTSPPRHHHQQQQTQRPPHQQSHRSQPPTPPPPQPPVPFTQQQAPTLKHYRPQQQQQPPSSLLLQQVARVLQQQQQQQQQQYTANSSSNVSSNNSPCAAAPSSNYAPIPPSSSLSCTCPPFGPSSSTSNLSSCNAVVPLVVRSALALALSSATAASGQTGGTCVCLPTCCCHCILPFSSSIAECQSVYHHACARFAASATESSFATPCRPSTGSGGAGASSLTELQSNSSSTDHCSTTPLVSPPQTVPQDVVSPKSLFLLLFHVYCVGGWLRVKLVSHTSGGNLLLC